MFKFKNKLKFGSSNEKQQPSQNPLSSSTSPDTRNSTESRKTLSANDLANDISKLSISQDGQSSESTQPTTQPTSSTSTTTTTTNTTIEDQTSPPGLLTVKIYNSQNIQLPIQINNSKQILHALAINSNDQIIGQQLLNNLNLLEKEFHEDYLPGSKASNFLPAIITIPNAENLVKSLLYLTIEFDNNVLVIEPQKGTVSQSTWNQVVSFDVTKKPQDQKQYLNLNLYIRLPNMLIPDGEKTNKKYLFTNFQNENNIGDLLIGTIKLPLNLKHKEPVRLIHHEYVNYSVYNNVQDLISNSIGDIMLTIDFKPTTKKNLSIEDFDLLKVIGKGSFGKVMQVVKKDTNQIYALKTLRKANLVSRMEITHTMAERSVLAKVNNPFIVPLKFSFQSENKLYLVLSFINGGELFYHLQREGKFSMDRSRFYIAELLSAISSLHEMDIIYRDLKPENILLDYQGHISLCDFGLCKLNMSENSITKTFCGTNEYLAPELLLNQGYTRSVDYWTLGTLLYEMLSGLPPFYSEDVLVMYNKILKDTLKFPSFLQQTDAEDLIIKMLEKDPSKRINNSDKIKSHPFFRDIDWIKLNNKSYLPPFKPKVANLLDTSNFDMEFTNEKPQDSVVEDFLSESVQKQFGGWTYNGDSNLQ